MTSDIVASFKWGIALNMAVLAVYTDWVKQETRRNGGYWSAKIQVVTGNSTYTSTRHNLGGDSHLNVKTYLQAPSLGFPSMAFALI